MNLVDPSIFRGKLPGVPPHNSSMSFAVRNVTNVFDNIVYRNEFSLNPSAPPHCKYYTSPVGISSVTHPSRFPEELRISYPSARSANPT